MRNYACVGMACSRKKRRFQKLPSVGPELVAQETNAYQ